MNILIVAPHPDDEVLGCGGVIAKHSKKKNNVYLCIVTNAFVPEWSEKFVKSRALEIKKSNRILGIKKTFLLGLPPAQLDSLPQREINKKISGIIENVKPDIVYIPFKSDIHKDHRIIFESCLVALRPAGRIIKKIMSYEVLSETEWGIPDYPFVPDIYIDITDTYQDKVRAMKAYPSELKCAPHPRSIEIIDALSKKRGSEAGIIRAEAFKLIREIDIGDIK